MTLYTYSKISSQIQIMFYNLHVIIMKIIQNQFMRTITLYVIVFIFNQMIELYDEDKII